MSEGLIGSAVDGLGTTEEVKAVTTFPITTRDGSEQSCNSHTKRNLGLRTNFMECR